MTGPQAVGLLDWFSQLERLGATGKALVAERAAATNQWRAGDDRSPEHWLARRTGTTVGAARDALDTARRVKSLPDTAAAMRDGRLSATQASAVAVAEAEAATADPAAEDEAARQEAIRRSRSLRRSVAPDGAHELQARGTAADIALFWSRLQPFVDAEFDRARREDVTRAPTPTPSMPCWP